MTENVVILHIQLNWTCLQPIPSLMFIVPLQYAPLRGVVSNSYYLSRLKFCVIHKEMKLLFVHINIDKRIQFSINN